MKKKYLVLPVNDKQKTLVYTLKSEDTILTDFTAAYDPENPVFEAYVDVTRFGDVPMVLIDPDGREIPFRTAEAVPAAADIPNFGILRPAVHYTTKLGWINDPNGLTYADGRYHMFYQHNPTSWNWGNMTWGHAVSEDLVHWDEWGDALYPDKTGTMFSGSGICDTNNAAGFGKNAILLFYTAAGGGSQESKDVKFTQGLAYSTDNGQSFTKYEKNPVIQHIVGGNRDPKVQWVEELQMFTLSLFLDGNTYAIFTSENLTEWTKLCEVPMPRDAECPDFYPLTTPDGERKWIFSGASDSYIVGDISNGTFCPCQEDLLYHVRPGVSYAAQTFSGVPGRRIKIAWDRVSAPGALFNSQMSVPMEMRLEKVDGLYRLASLPVKELDLLRKKKLEAKVTEDTLDFGTTEDAVDISIELLPGCGNLTISCFGMEVSVDPKQNAYCHGDAKGQLSLDGRQNLRIIFDTLSLEVFADDGFVYSSKGAIADRTKPLTITAETPDAIRAEAYALNMN